MSTETLQLSINGEDREVQGPITVAGLLEQLGIAPRHVGVERNRELVTKADYASTELETGDRLEIVTLVGGG